MLARLKTSAQLVWRRRRMEAFLAVMQPKPRARILDVGGLPELNGVPGMWELIDAEFQITLLNLPGSFSRYQSHQLERYQIVEADACRAPPDLKGKFDLVFSNGVIEHVGPKTLQNLFARFVLGAGARYWVQTPSIAFPLEAHCNLPFWWCYPMHCRKTFLRHWQRNGKVFLAKQMATTRPISAQTLSHLFPGCSIFTEKFVGLPKSISAYGSSVT
jgi:hypothetical protein